MKDHLNSIEMLRLNIFKQQLEYFKLMEKLSNEETVVFGWMQSQVDEMEEIKRRQYERN